MKSSPVPGITITHRFTVTEEKTLPYLFPESPDVVAMPIKIAGCCQGHGKKHRHGPSTSWRSVGIR